jgi:hypothetical protein
MRCIVVTPPSRWARYHFNYSSNPDIARRAITAPSTDQQAPGTADPLPRFRLVSLATLQQASSKDKLQESFETIVAAQALHELLLRDCAAIVASTMGAAALADAGLPVRVPALPNAPEPAPAVVASASASRSAGSAAGLEVGTGGAGGPPTAAVYREAEAVLAWRYFDEAGHGCVPMLALQTALRRCGLRLSTAVLAQLLRSAAGCAWNHGDILDWQAVLHAVLGIVPVQDR